MQKGEANTPTGRMTCWCIVVRMSTNDLDNTGGQTRLTSAP